MVGLGKYTKNNHISGGFSGKARQSIYITLISLFAIAVVVLFVLFNNANIYKGSVEQQLNKRINSSIIDAIEQVNRLTGGVQANSTSRIAMVRQYIFNIDQLNLISISINGEEGRLVPQEAILALYDDLDTYEKLVQTATSSTLEIRTTLLTHLTALKELL
ncbi:MAG: hypothetical protein GX781_00610 [Clostridiales bacterium]|nr:hypothetical protein [Clostridiales bacterium]